LSDPKKKTRFYLCGHDHSLQHLTLPLSPDGNSNSNNNNNNNNNNKKDNDNKETKEEDIVRLKMNTPQSSKKSHHSSLDASVYPVHPLKDDKLHVLLSGSAAHLSDVGSIPCVSV
jgi:hypothetical protein